MSSLGRSPGGPTPKVTMLSVYAGAAIVAAGLVALEGRSLPWLVLAGVLLVVAGVVLRSAVRAAREDRRRHLDGDR